MSRSPKSTRVAASLLLCRPIVGKVISLLFPLHCSCS
uniref:Uncharacterized protein n=1 Tax=Arundo donax TaxID=35708 RepID=A0A0A9FN86_ARUDO